MPSTPSPGGPPARARAALALFLLAVSATHADTGEAEAAQESINPVTWVSGGTLGTSQRWPSGTIRLGGTITLHAGLSIGPCTVVEVEPGSAIVVSNGGYLEIRGRKDCPSRITSASPRPAAGDWQGIAIWRGAIHSRNIVEHAIVEYGGTPGSAAFWLDRGASIVIRESSIRASAGVGVEATFDEARLPKFVGNRISGCASFPLVLSPGAVGGVLGGSFVDNGSDAVRVVAGTLEEDAAWHALDVPYRIENLELRARGESAHLTLEAGVAFDMAPGASLMVSDGAGLLALGEKGNPVHIRSGRGDEAEPGDWAGIFVSGGSTAQANSLSYTVVEHGGAQGYGALMLGHDASMAVGSSIFANNAGPGVELQGSGTLREFSGNVIARNGGSAVSLPPDAAGQLGPGQYGPNAIDGVQLTYGNVETSATWRDLGVPYLVTLGFWVGSTGGVVELTLAAGSSLAMSEGASISFAETGRLVVAGTALRPVHIASGATPPRAGDWNELRFHGTLNHIRHATLAYGGGAGYGQIRLSRLAGLTLEHVGFHASASGCDVDNRAGGKLTTIASSPVLCGD
jgi:hypothetical protein